MFPVFFFLRISRVSCASENPVICSRYVLRMVFSFFRHAYYRNRTSTVSIHSYFSLRDAPRNSMSLATFMNSLTCAKLTMCESFMLMVILQYDDSRTIAYMSLTRAHFALECVPIWGSCCIVQVSKLHFRLHCL